MTAGRGWPFSFSEYRQFLVENGFQNIFIAFFLSNKKLKKRQPKKAASGPFAGCYKPTQGDDSSQGSA